MGGPGSGGARTRSGPAANPNALKRQRDGKEWTKLPAAGRLALAPEWPDEVAEPNDEELLMWRRVWTLPQALVWEADHAEDMVAFYVRTYLEAMQPRAGAQARTFVGQMSEKLLLTPGSLSQQRYVIEGSDEARAIDAANKDHSAAAANPARRGPGRPKSAKNRFTVVGDPGPDDEDDEPQPETDLARGATTEIPDDDKPPF